MYRVILADDEVLIREAMRKNIHWDELGYELAACCENGREAVSVMEKEKIDLVITDICMPYMDGMELCKYIYEHHPETDVLILSGYDNFEYAKQAVKYKVEEYLLKPITAAEMTSLLQDLKKKLDQKRKKDAEYDEMKMRMRKNQLVIQSNIMMNLMRFSMPEETLLAELKANHIRLDKNYYRVAIIAADMSEEAKQENQEETGLIYFVIYNVANEIAEKYDAGEVFQGAFGQTVILFSTNRPKNFEETIEAVCSRIQKEIHSAMNLSLSIGIGNYVRDWREIHVSYEEAQMGLTYRYLLGGGQIIDMGTLDKKHGKLPKLTDYIEALTIHIRLNQQAKIREVMEQIQLAMQRFPMSQQQVCLTLQNEMELVRSRLESTEHISPKIYAREEQVRQQLPGFRHFEDLIQCLIAYYSEVAVELELQRNRSIRKPVIMAMDYLKKHYDDPDLTLQTMCRYLSISTSRFSTLFKDATGETFVEALTGMRIEQAKKLIERTNLKSYEVAERVGYSDPHYFSICFKKATGESPTEYAKRKRGMT